jgi:hypothetical protein
MSVWKNVFLQKNAIGKFSNIDDKTFAVFQINRISFAIPNHQYCAAAVNLVNPV